MPITIPQSTLDYTGNLVKSASMPFPFVAAAAGIGAAFNYFSERKNSKLQAQVARENTDKTIAYNKEANRLAYQQNLEQWNRENEYNLPQNQMARLKAAGLSPMMAYGNGTIAGNTAASSPAIAPASGNYAYEAPRIPKVNVGESLALYQDYKLRQAQINNVEANTRNTQQATSNATLDALLKTIEARYKGRGLAADTTIKESEAKYSERQRFWDLAKQQSENAYTRQKMSQEAGIYGLDLQARELANRLQRQNIAQKAYELKELMPLQREALSRGNELTSQKTQTEIGTQLMMDLNREMERMNLDMAQHGVFKDSPWYLKYADHMDKKFKSKLPWWPR